MNSFTIITFFVWVWLASVQGFAAVNVDMDLPTQFSENSAISGTIIVSHTSKEKIDPQKFSINKKPLEVKLQREQPLPSGDLILSMYGFSLPAQPKGLYVFPAVIINVNGKDYASIPRTYEITGSTGSGLESSRKSPEKIAVQEPPLLKLEAYINDPHEIYPGQRTSMGYRYFYNVNIDTTKEVLPLLEAAGLTKIGDKSIKAEETEGLSVQQFEQQVEGNKPGEYQYGPSILEGYPYQLDTLGNKISSQQLLSSTAPPIVLTVLPFPEKDKPVSFNGALGIFDWKVELTSSPKVNVGDEIELLIEAKGKGNLENLQLPEICCQPGTSGLFRLSDLPPTGEIVGETKRFQLKIRPLSTLVKSIPSLEFSSFDPISRRYMTYRSQPIPLDITTLEEELPNEKPIAAPPPSSSKEAKKMQAPPAAEPIEIESIYPLTPADLKDLVFGNWATLFLIPFGFGALLFQINLSKYLEELSLRPKTIASKEIFAKALLAPTDSADEHSLLSQAFLLSLKEKKLISSENITPEELSTEGIIGMVRDLLCALDENRYMGGKTSQNSDLRQRAQALFDKLQNTGEEM